MHRGLLATAAVLGAVLVFTAVPAPFTVDENNYLVSVLALRAGRLTVPGTEGLPISRELLYFDPGGHRRDVRATPVSPTVPPLYAPLALPFSFLGWRGLVALNTIAFLLTVLVVFALARSVATTPEAPWIAALAVGAGGYFIEYAQGMWPHLLTVALVAGATFLVARALEEPRWTWAAGAGLLAGLAAGVRYQNAFVAGCLGLGLLLLSRRRRILSAATFGLGAALPLAASSLMNWSRFGTWNPISKGPGYLFSASRIQGGGEGSLVEKVATMAWARIVDYSARPPLTGTVHESFLTPHPESGAFVLVTAVKKAWLQSSPWMIVPLILLVVAWLPARLFTRIAGRAPQRQLRLLSLVVIPTLGMFSASGVTRTDGFCFNQRYFCEMVPLVAVALAWGIEGLGARRTALYGGGLAGAALAFAALSPHHLSPLRHGLVMYLPLGLAALFAAAWTLQMAARARRTESQQHSAAVAFLLGASIAWGLTVHLGDDLQASRIMRRSRQDYLEQLRPYLPDHSAVFAGGGIKDALGPLQLERDVMILVPAYDRAATTEELLDILLAQGRRVFFLPNVLPKELFDPLLAGRQVRGWGMPMVLIEVRGG